MGTSVDMMLHPGGPILIGGVAGVISVAGYSYLSVSYTRELKVIT